MVVTYGNRNHSSTPKGRYNNSKGHVLRLIRGAKRRGMLKCVRCKQLFTAKSYEEIKKIAKQHCKLRKADDFHKMRRVCVHCGTYYGKQQRNNYRSCHACLRKICTFGSYEAWKLYMLPIGEEGWKPFLKLDKTCPVCKEGQMGWHFSYDHERLVCLKCGKRYKDFDDSRQYEEEKLDEPIEVVEGEILSEPVDIDEYYKD